MSENMSFLPKQDLLTLEELDRLCGAFVARGRAQTAADRRRAAGAARIMTLCARSRATSVRVSTN